MTLPKEDQAMIHLETVVLRDEMKVLIACNQTQYVTIQQQGWMTKKSWMGSYPRWMK